MWDSSLGRFAREARHPPLWARWVLAILGFLILVLVARLLTSGGENSSGSTKSERAAEVEANREAQVVVEEDEAPHSAPLRAGAPPRTALQLAIAADARTRIRGGELTGTLQSVRCAMAGPPRAGRTPFRCTARANGIAYPFAGVLDEHARQLTWCKVDLPPTGDTPEAPISPRCRA